MAEITVADILREWRKEIAAGLFVRHLGDLFGLVLHPADATDYFRVRWDNNTTSDAYRYCLLPSWWPEAWWSGRV